MNTKNKKLKIAIAGLGFGKKVHLEALKESDYLTPVAIYHLSLIHISEPTRPY